MNKKVFLLILAGLVTPVIIYFAYWIVTTDFLIREKFAEKSFLSPTQFYSNTLELQTNQTLKPNVLIDLFQRNNYRQKTWGAILQPSDYASSTGEECEKIYSAAMKCFAFHHHVEKKINIIATDELDHILVLLEVNPETQASRSLEKLMMFPQLFAQYIGNTPVIQEYLHLNQIPRPCLDAAMAVEDPAFLEHQGVSFRGLLRSQWVNLTNIRIGLNGFYMKRVEGGSTITQQLVKNYFLTADRKISRKIKEILMAFLVEARIPKDQILETYLNIIYLGQQGNFQVRGYSAASQYYFNKPITGLNLGECALLGAVVNNPGIYNPFTHGDRALARREKVLKAMAEQNRILPEDYEFASKQALPEKTTIEIKETAPYFIGGVSKELERLGYKDVSGFKIYTTLDLVAQSYAQRAVQSQLAKLETTSEYHQKNKAHSLQATLVASNPQNGEVLALVGGRDHRLTPYNRIFESKRQAGSIFKPIVYLAALESKEGFTPLTPLENSPYKHTYEKQIWEPRNYDNSFSEPVPAFYALKESLNIPTARLAIDTGLDNIIDLARDLGVTSPLKAFPALSLGAFEITPIEVLQVYTTLARFGSRIPLKMIKRIENMDGEILYTPALETPFQLLEAGDFATVTSMLHEVMLTGTGQSAHARGLILESAGKTGTTSNYKDAWFAGYSANHVAIVWTGYDDNTPIKLSGSSGALPIWTDYMLAMSNILPHDSFNWPTENMTTLDVSTEDLLKAGIPENKALPAKFYFYKK